MTPIGGWMKERNQKESKASFMGVTRAVSRAPSPVKCSATTVSKFL